MRLYLTALAGLSMALAAVPTGGGASAQQAQPFFAGKTIRVVRGPVQFDHHVPDSSGAPQVGEHTELVLAELGLDWDRIGELKAKGAIT